MNFLADEGVDRQVVHSLRQDGHNVRYIVETDPGITDDAVFDLATLDNLILLTADKDFGELAYRQNRQGPGIILLRPEQTSSATKAAIVTSSVRQHAAELPGAFVVITPGMLRIRHSSSSDI